MDILILSYLWMWTNNILTTWDKNIAEDELKAATDYKLYDGDAVQKAIWLR